MLFDAGPPLSIDDREKSTFDREFDDGEVCRRIANLGHLLLKDLGDCLRSARTL